MKTALEPNCSHNPTALAASPKPTPSSVRSQPSGNVAFSVARTLSVASLFAAMTLACGSFEVLAADQVHLIPTMDGKPGTILPGEILEIQSGRLRIKRADGREDVVPLARVDRWETVWPKGVDEATRQRREGKFLEAVESLRGATALESRTWAKRALIAQAIGCFREADQPQRAGELYLSLLEADPDSPHFDAIPLAWKRQAASRELNDAAQRWLTRTNNSPAVLLGASWLIALDQSDRAVEPLRQLTTSRDPRVALLAEAQLWRVRGFTSGASPAAIRAVDGPAADEQADTANSEMDRRERMIERLPASLRAGPYFVLGQMLAGRREHERAALALLRIPIEYPEHYGLAAESLELAATELEKLQRLDEAALIRRERAVRFAAFSTQP